MIFNFFFKNCRLIAILFIISIPINAFAHVQHYENLNKIKFDILRNNKLIGHHVFTFQKQNNKLDVISEINFEIKKLGVVLYRYHVRGKETYVDDKLVKFTSKTNQNGKEKYVKLHFNDSEYVIDGSSFKGKADMNYMLGTWWNHSLVKSEAQISAVSGRIIKQKVTFLGKEDIKINGKMYKVLHFNFSSTDNKLNKNKRLNTDVWYDEENLYWVKASFEKKGKWEYKLALIE
jgi:hypothetical protein